MMFDATTMYSTAQAVTASAPSFNVFDFGPVAAGRVRDIGTGEQVPILVQVVETFAAAGAATLTVEMQVSDTENFASPVVLAKSAAIPKADLVPGKVFPLTSILRGSNKRYSRLNYVVASGPFTAGKLTAGAAMGSYSDG